MKRNCAALRERWCSTDGSTRRGIFIVRVLASTGVASSALRVSTPPPPPPPPPANSNAGRTRPSAASMSLHSSERTARQGGDITVEVVVDVVDDVMTLKSLFVPPTPTTTLLLAAAASASASRTGAIAASANNARRSAPFQPSVTSPANVARSDSVTRLGMPDSNDAARRARSTGAGSGHVRTNAAFVV